MTCHELSSLTPELKKSNVLTVCVNVLQRTSIKNRWLSESALGKTRVTSIFWAISKRLKGVGYKCTSCTFAILYSVKGLM